MSPALSEVPNPRFLRLGDFLGSSRDPSGAAGPTADRHRRSLPGLWALPGGFIDTVEDEDLETCAKRQLKEKTRADASYLEQLGSWGSRFAIPAGWSATHVYFALMSADDAELLPGGNADGSRWHVIDGQRVQREAGVRSRRKSSEPPSVGLRSKVEYTSLPAFLMPHEFTLTELQKIYETLLDRPIEKKSFRTRMLGNRSSGRSRPAKEGANRPAQIYRLRNRRAATLLHSGFGRQRIGKESA